jgi:hypothetical protein
MKEFAPQSAFSEGDILQASGTLSNVSGINTLTAPAFQAVACGSSLDSVNGAVPCVVPRANDIFLSSLTPSGSLVTFGTEVDVEVDGAGRHYCGVSANTARIVMIDYATDQSTESQALVAFKTETGEIELA